MKKTNEAIIQLQKAILYMPENTRLYYNLSLLYDSKKDFKNGETSLHKGLKIEPNNETLLYALSYHYYTTNQLSKSKSILTKLVNLYPDNLQYYTFLQLVLSKQ